jgi:hypothetical protein
MEGTCPLQPNQIFVMMVRITGQQRGNKGDAHYLHVEEHLYISVKSVKLHYIPNALKNFTANKSVVYSANFYMNAWCQFKLTLTLWATQKMLSFHNT